MIYCSGLMEILKEEKNGVIAAEDKAEIEGCLDRLFEDIVFDGGCLFMKTYNGQAVLNDRANKAEFEAWYNEILINSEFPKKRITAAFAMEFFTQFCERLKTVCSEKMCSVISEDEGSWTFRFHIVREGEPLWLPGDIRNFPQPVLYEIFDGG